MRVLLVLVALLLAGCGPDAEESKGTMADSQFAELLKRPDIDAAASRHDEMRAKIRERLGELSWREEQGSSGQGSCSRTHPDVARDDGKYRRLNRWVAEGDVPDDKWPGAVATVVAVAREYGFGEPEVVVDRPNDHEVLLKDGDGAELLFGTAVNTILSLRTGCHLTPEAHKRGTPAPK